jgi:GntR family transcriptional regulator/MocR family aminotransferase
MKKYIDGQNPKAAYLQLYERLREDIVEGLFPLGSKLPSKRLLAEECGVSVITVEHAYAILAEEGYIEARPRSGYFSIYRERDFLSAPLSAASTIRKAPPHPSHTAFPYSVLARTMRKVLTDYEDALLIKSPNQGCAELREAIATYLARNTGIRVRPEQIIIGAGAEYLYSLVAQLLGEGRIFGLEDPSYDKIQKVYTANGIPCDLLKLGDEGIHTADLQATPATVLHITPFNSYPSGITATASKRKEYLLWAQERKGYIIEDNYDSEMTVSKKTEEPLFSRDKTGRVLYLNTFSRTVAPSMRVGYLVLPEELLPAFEQKLGFYSCTVSVFEQYVLAHLLNSGDFERHINRVRRARRKNLVI